MANDELMMKNWYIVKQTKDVDMNFTVYVRQRQVLQLCHGIILLKTVVMLEKQGHPHVPS